MTALTAPRPIQQIPGILFSYPVKANAKIYQGAIVCLDSTGYAVPASTATGLLAVGFARESQDATGLASGAIRIEVEEAIVGMSNSGGGDTITFTELGELVYLVDDQTVAKTSAGGTRSVAGIARMIEGGLIFVEFSNSISADGDLLIANNLSDVANAATSRANLGANKVQVDVRVPTLVGTGVTRKVVTVAGTITKIWTVIDGILTVGDATLTSRIGATAITDGLVTITQVGSAAGDKDSATPSALNVVAVGDVVSFTVGGSNATASSAEVSFLIET
jgi:hypothetical protein